MHHCFMISWLTYIKKEYNQVFESKDEEAKIWLSKSERFRLSARSTKNARSIKTTKMGKSDKE